MTPTEIVLAVAQCGKQICVARRSHQVATGQSLWSVVTGYIEADTDPLTQARTELNEELGLVTPGIRLVRKLAPVSLTSARSGKEFIVHPFLFECQRSEGLVLNWEHDDMQWVEPSRLLHVTPASENAYSHRNLQGASVQLQTWTSSQMFRSTS